MLILLDLRVAKSLSDVKSSYIFFLCKQENFVRFNKFNDSHNISILIGSQKILQESDLCDFS